MTTTDNTRPRTYMFGLRDRGGLLLGLRLPQLLVLGVGVAAILGGFITAGGDGGMAGFVVFAAAVAAALWPIQGRPVIDWVRPATVFLWRRVSNTGKYLGGPWALHRNNGLPRLDLPGLAQPLRVLETATAHGPVAVLRHRDRWTVLVQVAAPTYALADSATQERRVAEWGSLLAQCGQEGSHIAGIQWLERTLPDTGDDLDQWWHSRGEADTAYAQQYEELIADAGPAATRHETFLAVSIDAHRLRRPIRAAGGGPDGATKVLLSEMEWVTQALQRVDLQILCWVGASDLSRLVRTQYDPAASCGIDHRQGHLTQRQTPVVAGPMAAEAGWSTYRTDSGIHAVYWVAEWPQVPVEAGWCYPLLALGGIRRTISWVAAPIPPSASMRQLRAGRAAKRADAAHRARLGQVETATDEVEYDALDRRERELVSGHTEYLHTGYITVTADNPEQLEASCAQVEQAAVRSALQLRRVYGQVDQAFTLAGLPLCVGVRR